MSAKEIDEKLFQDLIRDHAEVIVHVGSKNVRPMLEFIIESGYDQHPPKADYMIARYGEDLCLYISGLKTPRRKTTMYGPIEHAQKCAKEEGFILVEYEDLLVSHSASFEDIDTLIRI